MPEYLNTFFISVIGGLASGLAGLLGLVYTSRYTDNRKLIDSTGIRIFVWKTGHDMLHSVSDYSVERGFDDCRVVR